MKSNISCPAFIKDVIRQCKTNSSRTAVIDRGGRETTYGEFYDIIKRTSGYIKARGIAPGSFLVINLPNCMEYLAIEFGAWLAGCAIAPVNPAYPEARIRYIAEHCESPLVVDEAVLEEIRKAEPLEICETTAPIAALFYTSGSTGNPKGVMHTFESLSHVDSTNEYAEIFPDDRFATGAPLSFIAWILTIPVLRAGACLCLIPRETMTDIRKLQAFYDKGDITCAIINPPSNLKRLDLRNNRSLRFVLTGSERASDIEPLPSCRIINLYGQTETALTALCFDIDKAYQNTPIGKPTSDFEMRIAEDGELLLRGPLTPGYYKDPERSAALWEGGWLHTGDIVRMLPDGNLEYVNRKDWMVKINGQRVETGEIAAVIKEVGGVQDAVAKGFTAPDGHQYLVAYYIGADNVGDSEVKEYISGKLAPYMIPSYFVKMAAFPTNFNGKVDIKNLQSPVDMGVKAEARDIVAPETENEKILCKGFESALGISPVGVDEDFFSLGGDSIRVMQLQVACPQLDLSSSLIYANKTVRAICAALEKENATAVTSGEVCPLSKTQTGIFVECMARRGEAVYNNPILLKITDPIDAGKLAAACVSAVKAHPNVFATIRMDENGSPVQQKNPTDGFKLEVENVSDMEFNGIRHTLQQPFDILGDRLFRMRLFKTESATWLFCDFHHVIFDGTSNSIMLEDIEKAYEGFEVEAETFTGFDVACEEQTLRESPFFEECRKWNVETFCEPDRISLPDPDRFNDAVSFGKFEINTGISAHAFARAAERLGVTENVLALGAFGHMLGACSHAKSSAFATVYNGRKSLKTARTMSMMVKTLPVFCKWEKDTRIGDYFKEVKDRLVGAMAHDLYSFSEICAATSYDSRVIFTWQDELLERNSLCGSACELISLVDNATGEPLAVQLYKSNGTLAIKTEYRSNMFSEQYLRKFISCFQTVLSSLLLAGKDSLASDIRLVPDGESDDIITISRGRKLDYDKSQTVVDMFRKHAAATPDAVAVVDENGSISYAELDSRSDRLASLLIEEGVAPDDFVALILPRLSCYPVSYMACFKCGAAFVPMDYEYPIDRLQYMLEDSGAKVLLTTRDIYQKKCEEGDLSAPKIIFVDELADDAGTAESVDRSRPDGLAYMIYTSGTTGRPKGVQIEHHSLMNLVHWWSDVLEVGQGTQVAEHLSFSFDGSLGDLMTSLSHGATLHLLASGIRKDIAAIYRYLCENKIESMTLSTQLGMAMLRTYDLKLKSLLVGGEKLSGQYKTSVKLINGYGPTEFTVASSVYVIDPENTPDNIPIGKAVPNTLSAIVDVCGRLLPTGVAGELVLVGEQLSRGYWNRPDITSERFVDCPFLPGEKMYHTGDLAKWSEEGELLFLGRIDTQVKLRGFRIELGEVESTLLKCDGVKSAVVAVKEIAGLQHLCAYYVADTELDKEAIHRRLAESLTDYMVPTAYMQMEALPLTPNGKVDLRQLPLPELKAEEIVEPATELETKLLGLVAESLKNSDFGVTTNLISMGLTSLGAITLSLQLEKAGIVIPSPKILELPTIRQMAEWLGDSPSQEEEAVPEYEKLSEYPLTDNQTGVYIDWEQNRNSTQYNVPMLFRFTGVEAETVAQAARNFIGAHPYLKACLKTIDGVVCQLRNDDMAFDVPVQALDAEPQRDFFQSFVKPFNLFEGPLFRFRVFSFGSSVWLLADIHHILFDGGSEALLAKEIFDSCNGIEIAAEQFTAFDYSLYYRDWKLSEDYSKAEQYFVTLLDGTVPASIPSTVNAQGTGSEKFTVSVPRDPVKAACRAAGVTENAFFLTAVTEVLHRFSREQNIAMLTVSNGRSLKALARTCGMFVQTLPVVSHMASRKVGAALKLMHGQIVDTLSRDKFPYTKIVEATGLKASILLAYQGDVLGGPQSVAGNPVEMSGLALDTAKMPLSINVMPGTESTGLEFEYDKAVFSRVDVENFASSVQAYAVNMAAADTDAMTGDIACVSSAVSDELVKLGSGPKIEVEPGTIVGLFKRNAASYPEDIAVTDCDGSITYAQLDKASDLLAGILLSAGLRKENFVSLMLPRRKEFVIAYLAVFKSGGAYVPMDNEYPIERLQYMVDDSSSKFLVTTHEIWAQKASEGDIKVANVIYVDDVDFTRESSAAPVDNSTPDGLAYMIYTSGTTGKPKGVMIEHHALMNMVTWNGQLEKNGRGVHAAEHASFSFDASVISLTTTIAFGGRLYIIDETTRKDPEMMLRYLTDNRIEVTVMSTQLGMMLLSSYKLPIRHIMMGGEKLTGKYDRGITVINGYGPTEFTVASSYHILDPDNESDNIPIGKAVPNTLSAIVDACGQLVPKGVPGELMLVGPQMARGYWNKDEITRKRFVPCPFVPGERMYHTGDLARWSDDGELLFMGRIDTQVKLRGFRIELGEIESQIANFKDVTAAVAQVKEIGGVQHLCAYFTAGSKIDTDELKSHLASCLTSYMVPDALMQMDEFPFTPNGKVDVKKLPLPDLAQNSSAAAFEAPEGETEAAIAKAFQKVLGFGAPLSRNASFFNMGGTSLLVMKVIVILSDDGYSVTYSDVFKYPTPQALAAFIEGYQAGCQTVPAAAAAPAAVVADEKPSFITGEDGFDYTDVNKALQHNNISDIKSIGELKVNTVGDVLLLGATGYLGIHVLDNLLTNSDGKVYCVVRGKKGVSCEGRLKSYLMYYFDKTFSDLLDERLFVIEGDMTDDAVMDKLLKIKVDTVINCAANVKHFAAGDEIEKINLNGTEKLIEYCLKTGSRLIHTSTHSISGQMEGGEPHFMTESELYFGQKLMTKYQTSKFAAERSILDAVTKHGLRAKIVRLGNLMPRFSDGEFQINIENNGFMSRMRAYYLIGCIPASHLHSALEFAPIDATADAILTLAVTPDKFTVFHPFNNHTIYIDDVVAVMRECGLDIRITDNDEFNARLNECLKDDHLNPYITTLLAYGSHNNYVMNQPSLDFTVHVLNAMDWRWPITGIRYLSDSFEKMKALEYFDK